jgi:hypothetical protein
MEVPQGNSLYSYLKQAKISFIFFLFCKTGIGGQSRSCDNNKRGEEVGKGCRRVNIVQKLCTHEYCVHMCKQKKRYLLKLFQEWWLRGGNEEEWWRR